MGLKIAWQNVVPQQVNPDLLPDFEVVLGGLKKLAHKVVQPDTEVAVRPIARGNQLPLNPYFEMLVDSQVVEGVIQAEKEGYDATMIGCYLDPGLREARCATEFPVTGASQSAMLLAQLLGGKFACVTVADVAVPRLEQNLRLYGLEDCAISQRPIRSIPLSWGELWPLMLGSYQNDGEELIEEFEKVAQDCIADGADVIITGCAWLGPPLSLMGYRHVADTGIPVVDCAAAGLAMAEMMAKMREGLGVAKSQGITSLYRTPDQEACQKLREEFGL